MENQSLRVAPTAPKVIQKINIMIPSKNGNRKDPVSQHPVDADRPLLSSRLMRLDHHIPAQLLDVFVPRIGQRRLPIHTAVKLHIIDDMPDDILLRLLNPQLSHYHLIAFDQLNRSESQRNSAGPRLILDEMRNGMNRPVHISGAKSLRSGFVLLCTIFTARLIRSSTP